MFRILAIVALLSSSMAYGQGISELCVQGSRPGSCVPVTGANPLPVTTTVSGSTTQNTNLSQVGGTATAVGAGNTDAGTQRVVISTNQASVSTNISVVGGNAVVTGGVNGLLAIGGNVASGVADTGNPVKVGAPYFLTAPLLTDAQRGDMVLDVRGNLRTTPYNGNSALSSTTTMTDASTNVNLSNRSFVQNTPMIFNGSTWDRVFTCPNSALISVAAGSTTELVALTASQVIRVCSFAITMSAAGTAAFVYGTGTNCNAGTTSITSAMTLGTAVPMSVSAGNGSLFRTASANALCLTAATGNVTGFVSYVKY